MANYPELPFLYGSVDDPSQKAQAFVDGAGGHHTYWPEQKKRFTVKHRVTSAQWATLLAFYAANQLASDIVFTWIEDDVDYTVKFLERPKVELIAGVLDFRMVTVLLGEA